MRKTHTQFLKMTTIQIMKTSAYLLQYDFHLANHITFPDLFVAIYDLHRKVYFLNNIKGPQLNYIKK